MTTTTAPNLAAQLGKLDAAQNSYASQFVSELLAAACQQGASDVHLHPTVSGLEVRWRIDGVLQPVGTFSSGEAADVVSRLKVLAGLLTYRTDVPQEGRLGEASGVGFQPAQKIEMRHYWTNSEKFVDAFDFFSGIIKSFFFGGAIALVSCYRGFHCTPGAEGVGRAATTAFVWSFVLILAIDLFLGNVMYSTYYKLFPDAIKHF